MNRQILFIIAGIFILIGLSGNVLAQGPGEMLGGLSGAMWGTICAFWVIGIVIYILIAIWVYRDAEKRGMSGVLWLIVILVAFIIGLIVYLIVRADHPVKTVQPTQEVPAFRPAVETMKIKCPSCSTVFNIQKNPSGPTSVRCPSCGKEGMMQ